MWASFCEVNPCYNPQNSWFGFSGFPKKIPYFFPGLVGDAADAILVSTWGSGGRLSAFAPMSVSLFVFAYLEYIIICVYDCMRAKIESYKIYKSLYVCLSMLHSCRCLICMFVRKRACMPNNKAAPKSFRKSLEIVSKVPALDTRNTSTIWWKYNSICYLLFEYPVRFNFSIGLVIHVWAP